jgi:hypothetical protein
MSKTSRLGFDIGATNVAEASKFSDFFLAIAEYIAIHIDVMFPQTTGRTTDVRWSV